MCYFIRVTSLPGVSISFWSVPVSCFYSVSWVNRECYKVSTVTSWSSIVSHMKWFLEQCLEGRRWLKRKRSEPGRIHICINSCDFVINFSNSLMLTSTSGTCDLLFLCRFAGCRSHWRPALLRIPALSKRLCAKLGWMWCSDGPVRLWTRIHPAGWFMCW